MTFLLFPPEAHDPGGKTRLALDSTTLSSARFSSCGKYRQLLTRCWDPGLPSILFVAMNPSTADANFDDPTVRKECNYARQWGYGSLLKCNVMDYRCTDPKGLLSPGVSPVSQENLTVIADTLDKVDVVVCAWGKLPKQLQQHARNVYSLLQRSNKKITCLGVNLDGSPKHPLYLKSNTTLKPYCLRD